MAQTQFKLQDKRRSPKLARVPKAKVPLPHEKHLTQQMILWAAKKHPKWLATLMLGSGE